MKSSRNIAVSIVVVTPSLEGCRTEPRCGNAANSGWQTGSSIYLGHGTTMWLRQSKGHGKKNRGERIRTSDLLVPNQIPALVETYRTRVVF